MKIKFRSQCADCVTVRGQSATLLNGRNNKIDTEFNLAHKECENRYNEYYFGCRMVLRSFIVVIICAVIVCGAHHSCHYKRFCYLSRTKQRDRGNGNPVKCPILRTGTRIMRFLITDSEGVVVATTTTATHRRNK